MSQFNWKIAGHLRTGLSHAEDNQGCQDYIFIDENRTFGGSVTVLADGLGSLVNSAKASKAATRAVSEWLLTNYEWISNQDADNKDRISREVLMEARRAIQSTKEDAQINDRDCNLAFVVVLQNVAVCGCLGDCAVCIISREDGHHRVLTNNASIANATSTVLTADAKQFLIVHENLENVRGFLLTSDGTEGEIYRKSSKRLLKNTELYFNSVFAGETKEEWETALSKRVEELQLSQSKHFDDDISIVVMSCTEDPLSMPADPKWLCRCGHRNSILTTYCSVCHADILDIYDDESFNRHESMDHMIEYFNLHPEEESLALKKQVSQKPGPRIEPPRHEPPEPLQMFRDPLLLPAHESKLPPVEHKQSAAVPRHENFVEHAEERRKDDQRSVQKKLATTPPSSLSSPKKKPTGNLRRLLWIIVVVSVSALFIIMAGYLLPRFLPSGPKPILTPSSTLPSTAEPLPSTQPTSPSDPVNLIVPFLPDGLVVVPSQNGFVVGDFSEDTPNGAAMEYASGSYRIGNFVNGQLHGMGAEYADGCLRIGNFLNGMKHGTFQVITGNGELREEEYQNGELVTGSTEPIDPGLEPMRVIQLLNRLRTTPGGSNAIFHTLTPGTIVYKTNNEPQVVDGVTYIHIQSGSIEGWIDASYVKPINE